MTDKLKKLKALLMALVLTAGIMSGYTNGNVVQAEGSLEITADKDRVCFSNGVGETIQFDILYRLETGQAQCQKWAVKIEANETYTEKLSDIFNVFKIQYGVFEMQVNAENTTMAYQAFTFVNAKLDNLQFDDSTKTLKWDDEADIYYGNISAAYNIYVDGNYVGETGDTTYNLSTYKFTAGKTYNIGVSCVEPSGAIVISNEIKTVTYEAPSDTTNTETDSSEETDTTPSENNKETETTEPSSSSSSDSSNNDSPSSDSSSDDSDSSSSETNTHQPSVGDSQGWDKIDNEINKVLSAPATTDGLKVLNVSLTDEDFLPENVISAVAKSGVIMSVRLNEDIVVNIDGAELDAYDATFTKITVDESDDYSTLIVNTSSKNLYNTITAFRRFPSQLIGHTVSLYFIDANGERITFATSPVYDNGYAAFKIPFVHAKYHIAID